MAQPTIKLTCERTGRRLDCLSALDCYTPHKEVIVPQGEIENFISDCSVWDIAKFDQGYSIETTIAAETWGEWVEVYEAVEVSVNDRGSVRLFAKATGEDNDCIGAYCPDDEREIIAPSDEAAAFIKDCSLWMPERFAAGQPVATTMTAENWAAWLEMFEVCDLDEETFDALCA